MWHWHVLAYWRLLLNFAFIRCILRGEAVSDVLPSLIDEWKIMGYAPFIVHVYVYMYTINENTVRVLLVWSLCHHLNAPHNSKSTLSREGDALSCIYYWTLIDHYYSSEYSEHEHGSDAPHNNPERQAEHVPTKNDVREEAEQQNLSCGSSSGGSKKYISGSSSGGSKKYIVLWVRVYD